MTTTTKAPLYTLNIAGREWTFTPTALAALATAGRQPWLLAAVLNDRLQSGLTEVTGFTRAPLQVRRSGKKVKVDQELADQNDPRIKSGAL